LISTDEVASRLGDPRLKLVEVDEDTDAYRRGHIPRAVSFDWRQELQEPVVRDFVSKQGFEQLCGSKGIGENDTVILYGGNNNWFAAYAYWYFKVYGHADVHLMDGGRKKWELEGRELTTERPPLQPTSYTANDPDMSIRAFRDEVLSGLGRVQLVDVRSREEFVGRLAAPPHLPEEGAQRKGHIPGAKNKPWAEATRQDGSYKSTEELRAIYVDELGLQPELPTVAYCRIGERSAHTWFALRELLGFTQVKNYDGSWTEYGSLVGVPIAREHEESSPEAAIRL
jgi:thiosulfate/3-mercaptopyruvate sulfurtransferase